MTGSILMSRGHSFLPKRRWIAQGPGSNAGDKLIITGLIFVILLTLIHSASRPDASEGHQARSVTQSNEPTRATTGREILIAGYVGAPFYYRSDVHLVQPGGTDVILKRLGWDGDALHFPIDGGVRSVEWWGRFGLMVDFLHNKAIARLGKGAHGRKLAEPIVETVDATGLIAGLPAPARLKLTELFERFEFTHGHNMLFLTPMVLLPSVGPGVSPYFGLGAGFALPHVEVWSPNAGRDHRTNEYQLAGPAAQFVAGLDFRFGQWSYFVEYKFSYAWISGALTGDQSWMNFNMPGDLVRQFRRWWRGDEPKFGHFSTTLAAHQIVAGSGYWFERGQVGN
jgi:hypothetical protein